jgi:hypothetical protein
MRQSRSTHDSKGYGRRSSHTTIRRGVGTQSVTDSSWRVGASRITGDTVERDIRVGRTFGEHENRAKFAVLKRPGRWSRKQSQAHDSVPA